MKTDIQIANEFKGKPISEIAKELQLDNQYIIPYGYDKAKINIGFLDNEKKEDGKLVLVTAITPTKAGEGKTTTTIGLGDALNKIGKKCVIALREPSMGPVFGIKGGACGGGYAQVMPMSDINLHFTGDMHAITAANNLISACLDNHITQGNKLNFDVNLIVFKRCLDINDRALRNVYLNYNSPKDGPERLENFNITVASEIMAVLCLATSFHDLKIRIARILLGYSKDNKPLYVSDLNIEGAITTLLKDAIHPNLVQTLEHSPAIIHGGPFANIAHGCNSILATKTALQLGEIVVTEAGFGADLGAEKFLDIKCPVAKIKPNAVVIVATIRALKLHGGIKFDDLQSENIDALINGTANLQKHIETIQAFGLPYVVCINKFPTDTKAEISRLQTWCQDNHHPMALSSVYEQGARGGLELAEKVVDLLEHKNNFSPLYNIQDSFMDKVNKIVKTVYGAKDVILTENAQNQLENIIQNGWDKLPICMAKTPNSLSDNAKLLNRPEDFTITIRELRVSLGSGFIVCLTGKVLTMPGLPKNPAAEVINISEKGLISGLN